MDQDSKNGPKLLNKAVKILQLLSETPGGLSVTAISRLKGLNKTTANRIVKSLSVHELVRRDEDTKRYQLGFKILELSGSLLRDLEISSVATATLKNLRDASTETVGLHIPLGEGHTCILTYPGFRELRYALEIGRPLPYHAGATGKLLLASKPDDRVHDLLKQIKLVRLGKNTIVDPKELWHELRRIRRQGYAFSTEERLVGGVGISAPVRDFTGQVIAAISIYGLISVMPVKTYIKKYKDLLLGKACEISSGMGYRTDQEAVSASRFAPDGGENADILATRFGGAQISRG